ncbi:YybH family protein [Neisseria weixii]|uniref:YybH family protein n=1 Tax=Neisseria weixii TaxID=1853276 RepID=UPI0035A13B42
MSFSAKLTALCLLTTTACTLSTTPPHTTTTIIHQAASQAAGHSQTAIQQIKDTLIAYQTAMAKADIDAIMAFFQDDAVIEFQGKPTRQSKTAIRQSYEGAFAVMDFTGIDYIVTSIEIYGDMAVVRTTHPDGATVYNKQQGTTFSDRNREVFVFKRQGDDWRIAYYMYNQKS